MPRWKDARLGRQCSQRGPRRSLQCAAALAFVCASFAATLAGTHPAHADEPDSTKAAHEAYERGSKAFARGNYAIAAKELAQADHLSPSPIALEAAIKAAILANDSELSMTLAARAKDRENDPRVSAQVALATEKFGNQVVLLSVLCAAPCTAKVGTVSVTPGVPGYFRSGNYAIEITHGDQSDLYVVQLPGGGSVDWSAPEKKPPPAPSANATSAPVVASSTPSALPTSRPTSTPLAPTAPSPVWFAVGTGLTAALAGFTVGFGVDTLSQHNAFELNPTGARAAAGRDAELRTNVFMGATATVAIATAILGYFTFRTPPTERSRQARTSLTPPATDHPTATFTRLW